MTGGLHNSCINCGKSGHETRNCPEPRREKHERPCWKCGKKGHMAYKCPDKDTPAKAVSAGAMPTEVSFGCVAIEDPAAWKTARGGTRRVALPTLADFVEKSFFDALQPDGDEGGRAAPEVRGGYSPAGRVSQRSKRKKGKAVISSKRTEPAEFDFEEAIEEANRERAALAEFDFEEAIEEALTEFDFEEAIEEANREQAAVDVPLPPAPPAGQRDRRRGRALCRSGLCGCDCRQETPVKAEVRGALVAPADEATPAETSMEETHDVVDCQWEILRSMVPGYKAPGDKVPKAAATRPWPESPDRRVYITADGEEIAYYERPHDVQQCHCCGETAIPKRAQVCGACGATNCLSLAGTETDEDDINEKPHITGGSLCPITVTEQFMEDAKQIRDVCLAEREALRGRTVATTQLLVPERPTGDIGGVSDPAATEDGWQKISVAIDSGAAETVIPHAMILGHPIRPTTASMSGVCYASATGAPIPNLGEQVLPLVTMEGTLRAMTFQAAPVSKPLGSVKRMCKSGHRVVFDDDGSYVENKATGELNWLREEDGNYMLDTWVMPLDELGGLGFGGQP